MLEFITIPLVVAMVTLGIYKLFELFVCKKERLTIIEKFGDKFNPSMFENKFSFPLNFKFEGVGVFGTLKAACLLIGVGLGLLIGYFICLNTATNFKTLEHGLSYDAAREVYGACVLIFGGLGLLISFLVEMKYRKNKKEE